mmetsp:Transcript_14632/g.28818  ORF Transcript_14632/g.28818 Transcript_14632/m.28818 type:complete len:201 (-) Transcript_14632:2-604(-)
MAFMHVAGLFLSMPIVAMGAESPTLAEQHVLLQVAAKRNKTTEGNLYGSSQTSCGSSHCGIDPPAIHAICLTSLPSNFCDQTKQFDWCSAEANSHHCVCLGAWSLYVKEGNTAPTLDCNAVPGSVLSDQYISSWKTWNGNEIGGQEVNGLQALYDQCNTGSSASAFKTSFCNFVAGSTALGEEQKTRLSSHASCSAASSS